MVVLDVGSGNTLTSRSIAREMVMQISRVIPKRERKRVILKPQLFESAPPNVPLEHDVFEALWKEGRSDGYRVSASVFDQASLDYLVKQGDVHVVKIANREDLRWLADKIPREFFPLVSCPTW